MEDDFTDIISAYKDKVSKYNQKVGELRAVRNEISRLQQESDNLAAEALLYGKCTVVLHQVSSDVQDNFIVSIEKLVSEGLSAVFEEDIKFRIKISTKGKLVAMDFSFLNRDESETGILDARGGGLVTLTGIILRVIVLRLLEKSHRQVLFLDEPLSMLSAKYLEPAAQLLRNLADNLNIQIVMITHQPELAEYSDVTYNLEKIDNEVVASRVTI